MLVIGYGPSFLKDERRDASRNSQPSKAETLPSNLRIVLFVFRYFLRHLREVGLLLGQLCG